MNRRKQKNDVCIEDHWSEILKGWKKFIEFLKDNPDLINSDETTLKDCIFADMMCEILNNRGVKNSYQIEDAIGNLSVDMSEITPQVDEDGILLGVKENVDRFEFIVKNKKGKIERHFLPKKAIKYKPKEIH